ncbi:MAG: hypothetical protein R6U50_08830 [Desulfobacterales bacterium]
MYKPVSRFLLHGLGFIVVTAIVFTLTNGVSGEQNTIFGPGPDQCPAPDKCGACHINQRAYDELTQSVHADLSCFDCHLPGLVQKTKYERKDRSFNRLGYHIEEEKWHESMGNDICLRCHDNRVPESASEKQCWTCHMPVTGVDEIVFVKDKKEPPTEENIREIKKMPHRSHYFEFH